MPVEHVADIDPTLRDTVVTVGDLYDDDRIFAGVVSMFAFDLLCFSYAECTDFSDQSTEGNT